jgi:hypothetical protein
MSCGFVIWFYIPVKEANTEPAVPTYLPRHHTCTLIVLYSIALSLKNLISENKCNTTPIVCSWILHFPQFYVLMCTVLAKCPKKNFFPRFYIILFVHIKTWNWGFTLFTVCVLFSIAITGAIPVQTWTVSKAPKFPENQHMKLVRLSALCTRRLEPPSK